jgi:capsular polysaccharide biosynthesis protein
MKMFSKLKHLMPNWNRKANGKADLTLNSTNDSRIVEVHSMKDLTIEKERPAQIFSSEMFIPYRLTLRPSRLVSPHKNFLAEFSLGTQSVELPECLTDGETYNTYDQTYGIFSNVLAYSWLGCVVPTPGTVIYETDRAAAAWPRENVVTPGMDWVGDDRFYNFKTAKPSLVVSEPCLFTTHGSISAYGHWMSDFMSSVWLWRDELQSGAVKLMMPYEQQPWFHKMLDVFGIPTEARIQTEGHLVNLNKAIIAKSCGMGNVVFPPDVMTEIGEHFVGVVGGARTKLGHRRIYLTRGDTGNWSRPIVNETSVIEKLSSLSFEIINPAKLSFLEQVKIFSEASIVVSAHGSSLVNLIFAPVGCKVIDLMPEGWTGFEYSYRWIYRLTNILQQSYILILLEQMNHDNHVGVGDIQSKGKPLGTNVTIALGKPFSSSVNIELLERAVRGCL